MSTVVEPVKKQKFSRASLEAGGPLLKAVKDTIGNRLAFLALVIPEAQGGR